MSYARKAVGSVKSIAHGPTGTCSKLVIARFNPVTNLCRLHWAVPLSGLETTLITPLHTPVLVKVTIR